MNKHTTYKIPDLFTLGDIESKSVLKHAGKAHQILGELKGIVQKIPNQSILLGTLPLQEAKESSEIENIITTQDEIYRSDQIAQQFTTQAAKEVHRYVEAITVGYHYLQQYNLINGYIIKRMQSILEGNDAGYRCQEGTELINERTGESIYKPPQHIDQIEQHMHNLERFINDSAMIDYDPLVKMALIHHQFESIHPFYDGNGRTGRIINILYLIHQGLLDTPILYLSRYINRNKSDYYYLLQHVRTSHEWESWLIFILEGVADTAKSTIKMVQGISSLMQKHKHIMKKQTSIYSHELLNNLYKYPYTKIDYVVTDCNVHRNTAARYLKVLEEQKILSKHKIGKENFYINTELYRLLIEN